MSMVVKNTDDQKTKSVMDIDKQLPAIEATGACVEFGTELILDDVTPLCNPVLCFDVSDN